MKSTNTRPFPQRSLAGWIAAAALLTLIPVATALADPPSRVARLAITEGAVSFSPAGDNDWVSANLNRPLVTGDRLWADADGRVEIQLAGATVRMGAMTNVALVNLDDRMQQFQLTQGTLQLRVRALVGGEQIEIDTPNFAFVATRPGVYRFDVDPDGAATTIYVRGGEGDVYGDGAAFRITSGQIVRFRGTDLRDSVALGVAPPDPFDRWAQTRDVRYDSLPSARYVAPEVIGYEDLDAYGTWRTVADVGNVWTPRSVPAGWAPYRNGHWTWIDPWGWTWVDDAPWGFAPFHYGRWALVGDRWGWVPGPVRQRPVYAPALVAFIGGANFSLSVSSGQAIGWFPLGPGEVYRPAYTVSRDYFTRVNVTNTVVNTTYVTNIYNNRDRVADVRYANFARPAAITAVAPSVFTQAQPVQRSAVAVDRQLLDKAQVIPLAKIAPQRESVTGASPAARAAPSAAMQKPVVARTPPPPAPASLESKLPALRAAPGKPLDRAAADTARSGSPQPASSLPATTPVRIVKGGGDPKPMPAQSRSSNQDAERGKGAAPRDERVTPPPTPPPPASTASPAPIPRGDARGPSQPAPRDNAKAPPQDPIESPKGPPSGNRAETVKNPPPRNPGASAKGPMPQNPTDNAKGPPPRDERGVQPRPPQADAPVAPRPQPQPQQAPTQQPQQRAQPERAVAPPPAQSQVAPPAPPAQRPPEPRGNDNGPPPRTEGPRPQRTPAPPPQSAPQAPPQPAPQPAPRQVAPKSPPQPAAAAPAPSDEAKGKGKGNENRRKEDDDKNK